MLSLFPSLLSFAPLAPFLIRLTLGIILILWTLQTFKNGSTTSSHKTISGIEGIAAILLIIGAWTQGAALFIVIDLIVRLIWKIRAKQFLTNGINYYLILLVLAVTLLLTGAGGFAFDYPL